MSDSVVVADDEEVLKLSDSPLKLDDEFLRKHTKVVLISDASDKTWKVKLDGDKLVDGWEEFARRGTKFRDGDVLVFRHEGDEVFHVSVSSRSVSGDVHNASSRYVVDTEEDCYIDDDDVESDDGEEEQDDDDGDDEEEGKATEQIYVWFLSREKYVSGVVL